jgi:hypothetical protein
MARNFLTPITVGGKAPSVLVFSMPGTLTVGVGTIQLPIWRTITIQNVRVRAGTQPTGAAIIVDINKNGTTIFTTQANRPTIAVSTSEDAAAVPDVTSYAAGDYVTVDVDQIGSTVAGSDIVIVIEYI